ncbi:glycosyltransferase family 2 protein [Paenibacillus sp. 1011MAR3C5]|uniref:tetratricopeptide repeat-containing glycosyltransferase family 2 protein n=1 Tax=Paenibacillus sp. 1011MAR3C5 TaxID=1675787 RepID=UPI000E6C1CF3|nr:glycosyltransferase family 2 protein [Paenibacillus sp. 1011MAR3C5]RJE85642.1 glycosyltransferase family 2 protein [Paenibacillus sp. 1011MAR3C5]
MNNLLSVCMIVKDEEDTLDRCLKSIKDFADEIIIVDTGSTDATKDIAKKYTEHIYDFKWVNNFSTARNESIKYASGKWILVLDADEYISTEDIRQFRLFLEEEDARASIIYTISVISYVGESIRQANITEAPIPRLFPNHMGIQYHRPIHEQPIGGNGELLTSIPSPITVFHTGYTRDVIEKKDKLKRNELIFTELKKKNGFTAYDHFTIGNECAAKNDQKRALYYYERAFQKATESNPWRFTCAYEMWNIYLKLDRIQDAWDLNERFFGKYKNHPEYYCFQGVMFEQFSFINKAKQSFLTAFQLAEELSAKQERFFLVNPSFGSTIPLSRLAHLASLEHNNQDMIYYYTMILKGNPLEQATLIKLIERLSQHETTEQIISFLSKLYPEPTQRDLILLVNICTSLGVKELAVHYYNQLTDPEALRLESRLKFSILTHQPEVFMKLLNLVEQPVSASTLRLIAVGAIAWNSSEIMNYQDQLESDDPRLASVLQHVVQQNLTVDETKNHAFDFFHLLTDLFLLQQYEQFDQYVSTLKSPLLLNLLANFFYSKQLIDLSVGYYQTLLEEQELHAGSLLNLAYMHINDHLYDDGISFLEEAIRIEPGTKQSYLLLLLNCPDDIKKHRYRKQFFEQFSHYGKLPFLQELQ